MFSLTEQLMTFVLDRAPTARLCLTRSRTPTMQGRMAMTKILVRKIQSLTIAVPRSSVQNVRMRSCISGLLPGEKPREREPSLVLDSPVFRQCISGAGNRRRGLRRGGLRVNDWGSKRNCLSKCWLVDLRRHGIHENVVFRSRQNSRGRMF